LPYKSRIKRVALNALIISRQFSDAYIASSYLNNNNNLSDLNQIFNFNKASQGFNRSQPTNAFKHLPRDFTPSSYKIHKLSYDELLGSYGIRPQPTNIMFNNNNNSLSNQLTNTKTISDDNNTSNKDQDLTKSQKKVLK
jgi:hypothetical protein